MFSNAINNGSVLCIYLCNPYQCDWGKGRAAEQSSTVTLLFTPLSLQTITHVKMPAMKDGRLAEWPFFLFYLFIKWWHKESSSQFRVLGQPWMNLNNFWSYMSFLSFCFKPCLACSVCTGSSWVFIHLYIFFLCCCSCSFGEKNTWKCVFQRVELLHSVIKKSKLKPLP